MLAKTQLIVKLDYCFLLGREQLKVYATSAILLNFDMKRIELNKILSIRFGRPCDKVLVDFGFIVKQRATQRGKVHCQEN